MTLLREDDVRAVLTMPAAIDVLNTAFRLHRQHGATRNVPRSRIVVPGERGVLHVLSAYVPGQPGYPEQEGPGILGFKAYSAYPRGVRFSINLYSGEDGALLAMIEADWLGQVGTGATSGLASRYMARQDASGVGLIGTRAQARTQLLAMTAARTSARALVYGRDSARRLMGSRCSSPWASRWRTWRLLGMSMRWPASVGWAERLTSCRRL